MNKLKELRKQKGLRQQDVADILSVAKSTYSYWESGKIEINNDNLFKLAEYYGVSIDHLLGRTPYPPASQSIIVPVYGVIPAGLPMEAIQDIIDYEEIPAEMAAGGKEFFALKLRGNSMYPDYEEGDIVIYQKADDCDSGDECAVIVNGDDATFKKVIKQKGGVVLQPLNVAEYEPMYYSDKEIEELPVRVIGIARELRRKK